MKSNESRRRFLGTWLAGGALVSSPTAFAGAPSPENPQGMFNVREFGAVANGQTLDTKALQSGIDAAASSGGMVYFPPGTYRSGTLFLKSHVSLYLQEGALLLGSTNLADFPSAWPSLRSYTDIYVHQSLIYAENVENVSLLGRGTIDGQGTPFKGRYGVRPYLIRMVNCRNVYVADLTLKDSPMWVQHYLACENLSIRGLTVHSRCNANNDGLDIDACEKVRISDCEIFSGDDAIVLKSTLDRPCRDVTVTNCVVSSRACGIKMGTESVGGFENVVITNCTVYDTGYSGIALEIVDGGKLENIIVSNIAMRNVRSAIFLRLGNRARPIYEGAPRPGLGSFRNVVIRDIQADGAGKVGCAICGLPEQSIENVTLANIRIRFEGGGSRNDAGRDIPENPSGYPENDMFGVLPAYGFYCRHVKNVRILNTQVGVERQDIRPALVCDDVEDLRVSDFETANSSPVLLLRNTRNAWIESNRAPKGNEVYLRLEGKQTENLCLASNDLRHSKKPVDLGPEVAPDAVAATPPPKAY
ncbi:MAG: glycoside hydrolase family 28 protein [Terriglobia bacterium]